jgi:hypothetical protein
VVFRTDEVIEHGLPGIYVDWGPDSGQGLKRPMSCSRHWIDRVMRRWPGSALLDPPYDMIDRVTLQGVIGRHDKFVMRAPNCLNQEASIRIARHDGRPVGATLQKCVARIDAQFATLFLSAVALSAIRNQ